MLILIKTIQAELNFALMTLCHEYPSSAGLTVSLKTTKTFYAKRLPSSELLELKISKPKCLQTCDQCGTITCRYVNLIFKPKNKILACSFIIAKVKHTKTQLVVYGIPISTYVHSWRWSKISE